MSLLSPPSLTHPSTWPLGLAAITLGVSASSLAYRFGPQAEPYSQFTVGAITWSAAAKIPDYLLLATLVSTVAAAWGVLAWVTRHIDRKFGAAEADAFVSTVAFCTLPAVAWAASNLYGPMMPLHLVHLASVAIALCIGATALLLRARRTAPMSLLAFVMTSTLLGALFLPVLAVGVNRVAFLAGGVPIWRGSPGPSSLLAAGAAAATLVAVLVVLRAGVDRGRHLLGFLQLPYPWAFLIVLPMPWGDAREITGSYPMQWLPAGALVLVAIGYADLMRRWLDRPREGVWPWMRVVSPVGLAAVIAIFRVAVPPTAYVTPDDYHFGEWLLPWWSWIEQGQLPFRDYVPARGMVNYVYAAVASLLGDGSASFIAATGALLMAAAFAGLMTVTAALVGTLPAAAMYLLLPISDRITDIELVLSILLMVGWYTFFRTTGTRWALGWLAAAIPAFLFAPGQAMLMGIATAPLLIWQLGRGALDEPKTLRRAALWTIGVLTVAVFVTPLGAMIRGAWRYVAEHSAVASVAHGIAWGASVGTQGVGNYWIAEAIRTSFIVVPITALCVLGASLWQRDWAHARRVAVVAIPVLLLGILYIPRAAGRIDPGAASRLGLTSAWMHATLMPVLLWSAWGSRRWPAILSIAIFVLGALTWMMGGILHPVAFVSRAVPHVTKPATMIDGAALGVPALGYADVDPAHAGRLLQLRQTLDALLDLDETYLDLTSRNAHYFYFNRRVPIESGAIYNLPNEAQQARAIRRLEAEPVPVVLASSDNVTFDGGPPSLRGHALYRYSVQRYTPIKIATNVFLIRPDRLERARGTAGLHAGADPYLLLDEAFLPPPLQRIPIAWGKSWGDLQEDAVFVRQMAPAHSGDWTFAAPIAGRDAGLLVLETSCAATTGAVPELSVSWSGEIPTGVLRFHSGSRLVIPLDASPRWLLARQITALHLRTSDNTGCSLDAITRAELWQRRIAAVADPK